MKNRLFIATLLMILCLAASVASASRQNLVKMVGASANYDDPLDYEKNPVAIADAGIIKGKQAYDVKVALTSSRFHQDDTSVPLQPSLANYVIGLGLNPLNDPDMALIPDQQQDNMVIGTPVEGQDAVEFRGVWLPMGKEFRMNLPTHLTDVRKADGSIKKGVWKNSGAPLWGHIGGWEAAEKIYTVDADGDNNGYALVGRGGQFFPCGAGNIGPPVKGPGNHYAAKHKK